MEYICVLIFSIFSLYATQQQMLCLYRCTIICHANKAHRQAERQETRQRARESNLKRGTEVVGVVGCALPVWMVVVKQSVNARVYFPLAAAVTQASFMWLTHGYTVTLTHLDTHRHTPWPTLSTAHTEHIHMNTQPLSSSAASTARLDDSCSTAIFNHQFNI